MYRASGSFYVVCLPKGVYDVHQFRRLLHCPTGVMVRPWRPAPKGIRDTLNKSLTPSAFTPSFLRRQEPKTLWTEVPAFAGTTGRDKHPSHGLIQRFLRTVDLSALRELVKVGHSKPSLRRRPGRVARRKYCRMYFRYYQSISYRMDKGFGAARTSLLQNCFSRINLLFKWSCMDTGTPLPQRLFAPRARVGEPGYSVCIGGNPDDIDFTVQ